jgi:hypothetical protein
MSGLQRPAKPCQACAMIILRKLHAAAPVSFSYSQSPVIGRTIAVTESDFQYMRCNHEFERKF